MSFESMKISKFIEILNKGDYHQSTYQLDIVGKLLIEENLTLSKNNLVGYLSGKYPNVSDKFVTINYFKNKFVTFRVLQKKGLIVRKNKSYKLAIDRPIDQIRSELSNLISSLIEINKTYMTKEILD